MRIGWQVMQDFGLEIKVVIKGVIGVIIEICIWFEDQVIVFFVGCIFCIIMSKKMFLLLLGEIQWVKGQYVCNLYLNGLKNIRINGEYISGKVNGIKRR